MVELVESQFKVFDNDCLRNSWRSLTESRVSRTMEDENDGEEMIVIELLDSLLLSNMVYLYRKERPHLAAYISYSPPYQTYFAERRRQRSTSY